MDVHEGAYNCAECDQIHDVVISFARGLVQLCSACLSKALEKAQEIEHRRAANKPKKFSFGKFSGSE